MITLSKIGNAIRFTFADSQHYLTGDGTIDVPVNSLSLIFDESTFATFKKAASNDIFVSAPLDEFGMTKAELITFYTTNMVGSTGGGGGGGVTSGEVQTMIDNSISGKANTSDVTSALSGETTRAMASEEALSGAVSAVTDALEDKVDVSELEEVELAVAQSINVLAQSVSGKQDTLVYYSEDTETNEGKIGTSFENGGVTRSSEVRVTSNDEESAVVSMSAEEYSDDYEKSAAFYGTQDGIEIDYDSADNVEGTSINNMIYVNADGIRIETNNDDGESVNTTEFSVTPDGVTINGDEVVTTSDLTASLSGKQDTLVAGSGIAINGNVISATGGGGGGNASITSVTQAQYEQISGSADPSTLYVISDAPAVDISNYYTKTEVDDLLLNVEIDVDTAITQGSTNAVEGGAIYDALQGKANTGTCYSEMQTNNTSNGTALQLRKGSNYSWGTLATIGSINGTKIATDTAFQLVPQTAITTSMTSSSTDSEVPSAKAVYDAMGGLTLLPISQADYDLLPTKDPNTLYIITNVVNNS